MNNNYYDDGWNSPDHEDEPSGQVRFDDRGNAVWDTWSGKALEHPGLALDESPSRKPEEGAQNGQGEGQKEEHLAEEEPLDGEHGLILGNQPMRHHGQ